MMYRYGKSELHSQLIEVMQKATLLLRRTGLNDAQISDATHGRMDDIEITTDGDIPTLQFMLVSVLMDCRDVQRLLDSEEISEARGEVKSLQVELKRLDGLPLTVSGWKSKTHGGRGGSARKRKDWAEALAMDLVDMGMTFNKAWCQIPEDEFSPIEIDDDTAVYRTDNGEKVVAFDPVTEQEIGQPLTRSSFQRYYFRPAKNGAG